MTEKKWGGSKGGKHKGAKYSGNKVEIGGGGGRKMILINSGK